MNPLDRNPKILKDQAREFVKKIETTLNRAGARCKLTANLRVHENESHTLVSFRPDDKPSYAPLAIVKTIDIFTSPKKTTDSITAQLHYKLKELQRAIKAAA